MHNAVTRTVTGMGGEERGEGALAEGMKLN